MISAKSPLILGSASPRRYEILTGLGIRVRVVPGDALEDSRPQETPLEYIERVVKDKLRSVAERVTDSPSAGVLVADTVVVLDRDILGKPKNVAEAEQLLARLVGRTHRVLTRYAIALAQSPATASVERTVESQVSLRSASSEEIKAYAQTGEGLDKAGAYAAQGIGAFLVQRIEGSYTNVVGLPACEVVLDLQKLGLLGKFPSLDRDSGRGDAG